MTILFIDTKAAMAGCDDAVRRFHQAFELSRFYAAEVRKYLSACHTRQFANLLVIAVGALKPQA